MNKFRFHIAGHDPTPWEIEHVRSGAGVHTAVQKITELRRLYPDAAITIEREGEEKTQKSPMFRYDIYVKDGLMPVQDDDGIHLRQVKGRIQTRPFYEREREMVLTEIRERFPDAQLQEVKVG